MFSSLDKMVCRSVIKSIQILFLAAKNVIEIHTIMSAFLGQSATVGRVLTYSYHFERGQDEFVCGVIPSRG